MRALAARVWCAALALLVAAGVAQANGCGDVVAASDIPGSVRAVPGSAAGHLRYAERTNIYGHGIMGAVPEALTLVFHHGIHRAATGCTVLESRLHAGAGHVFEDMAPRPVDVTGDGQVEAVTVRSSLTKGAQLAIYGDARDGQGYRLLAATPYIGRRNRWLAPVAWADLDGDGAVEIAYVDRPHLAKILRIWRYADGVLTEVATREGVTNHRIGEETIFGGLRDCGEGPEMVLATDDWSGLVAIRFDGTTVSTRDLGPMRAIGNVLACG